MRDPLISVVIRTLNEGRYLRELLESIESQTLQNLDLEVVIVDSGSTDNTLPIAQEFGCRITYISKQNFTFGRSLNIGSEFARGDYLVYVSGHCIPTSSSWIQSLVAPLIDGLAGYSYGAQIGRDTTKFSEQQLFNKYFPSKSEIPQIGYFCNNANAAISRSVWQTYRFNEEITGLEDMELAKRFVSSGGSIAYVAEGSVFHIHDETWRQIRIRYERESVALKVIMPELRISLLDTFRFIVIAVVSDASAALRKRKLMAVIFEIILFRTAQYFGSYKGNRLLKRAAEVRKEAYFYPKDVFRQ